MLFHPYISGLRTDSEKFGRTATIQGRSATVSETAAENQGSRIGQQHIVRRKEEMRQQLVGSALSSADPMQVAAKIVSLIDTTRYIN